MELIAYIILGILIGGVVVWLLAKARFQGIYTKQISDLQISYSSQITDLEKRASGAEARVEELRQQVGQKVSEISQVRKELEVETTSKVEAFTRLEESQKGLEEQKALIETMKAGIRHMEALRNN